MAVVARRPHPRNSHHQSATALPACLACSVLLLGLLLMLQLCAPALWVTVTPEAFVPFVAGLGSDRKLKRSTRILQDGVANHPASVPLDPAHKWQDGMQAVVPARTRLASPPMMIGVAADSGVGVSTFLRRIVSVFGTDVEAGHTAVGSLMTIINLDDYRLHDRVVRSSIGRTALDLREIDFDLMRTQVSALKSGMAIYKPVYNHETGLKDPPELVEPNQIVVIEGFHPLVDEGVRRALDLSIYIDIDRDMAFGWKARRDVEERGWPAQQVQAGIEAQIPDFEAYVDPQKAKADVVLHYEVADPGLPRLKVKLIQRKGGAVPLVKLTKSLELSGPVGGSLRMYDDVWSGRPVSVLEMEGEFDHVDIDFEGELKDVQSHLTGLAEHWPGELTDIMLKMKQQHLPGCLDGTGLFQSIVAMQVRKFCEEMLPELQAE